MVDAAITDGVVNLMAQFIGQSQRGAFVERRESNMPDGGCPWYGVYETADGPHVSVGPLEPQFFARLCELLQLGPEWQSAPSDRSRWPALREALAQLFKSRPAAHWRELLEGTDACFAPVLPLSEAARHPHNVARGAFVVLDGVTHPAPAPRFSRTPAAIQSAPAAAAGDLADALGRWRG